jgi:hypothetical protein
LTALLHLPAGGTDWTQICSKRRNSGVESTGRHGRDKLGGLEFVRVEKRSICRVSRKDAKIAKLFVRGASWSEFGPNGRQTPGITVPVCREPLGDPNPNCITPGSGTA